MSEIFINGYTLKVVESKFVKKIYQAGGEVRPTYSYVIKNIKLNNFFGFEYFLTN